MENSKDDRLTRNVVNLILVSKSMLPVNIKIKDYRYLVLKMSNLHIQDPNYFDALYHTINKFFMIVCKHII